jgi:hypothetical protein
MTLNDSMDGAAFSVFIEKFVCPQLWPGGVVVWIIYPHIN